MEELERSPNFRLTESDNGRVGKKSKFQADRVRQWKSWKEAQRTCNGFVLQMAHFYSKKSIVKKSLQNITK